MGESLGLLSEADKVELRNLEVPFPLFSHKIRQLNLPLRLTALTTTSTLPTQPGLYLVGTTPVHFDGLEVLPDLSIRVFPSDSDVTPRVLTQDHPYVQQTLINTSRPFAVVKLILADPPKMSKKEKRKRDQDRAKQNKKACRCPLVRLL